MRTAKYLTDGATAPDDSLISLRDAAALAGVSHMTAWRWARRGIAGIHLAYVRRGRRILTTREAIERFQRKVFP